LKRRFAKEDIIAIQGAYKALFRGENPIKETAANLIATQANAKVAQLCQFILESKRGIPFERKKNGE